jgi:hypothetical protein
VKLVGDLFLFLQGCASWKWYFPYHYAPFASDFVNIAELSTDFEKGTKPVCVRHALWMFFTYFLMVYFTALSVAQTL